MTNRWLTLGATLAKAVEIGARVAWDNVAKPEAVEANEVPWAPQAITPQWLTRVVCRDHPGVRVESVTLGTGSSGSTTRSQLLLRYDAAGERLAESERGRRGGLPASLFAKMTPSWTSRLAYGTSGSGAAEACFFTRLRPELEIEAPWGYHAAFDPRTFRTVLLMEDLVATRGATFCTPRTKISRANAEDIVTTLAAIHGRFFRDPRLETEFRALKTIRAWYELPIDLFQLEKYHDMAMAKAAAVIPPAVVARCAETWPAFRRAVESHASLPQTFLHSDVHLGNWYVTAEGRMGLCDWGCVMKGNGARDFAYAVSATLDVEDRRAWERDLLTLYLDRLHAAGGESVPFAEGFRRYRQQLFCALLMWTPTLCHSPLLPDMQPEAVATEMIRRISTAIGDHDALDA